MGKTIRNSKIEMLRIMCMFLIMYAHIIYEFKGWIKTDDLLYSVLYAIGGGYSRIGCTVFFIITAWYLCDKEFKIHRIVNIYLIAVFWKIVIDLFVAFFTPEGGLSKGWLGLVFRQITKPSLWYVSIVLMVLIVSPLLNVMIAQAKKDQLIFVLLVSGIVIVLLPTITLKTEDYYTVNHYCLYLYLYLFIGTVKKYYLLNITKICNKNVCFCVGIGIYLLLTVTFGFARYKVAVGNLNFEKLSNMMNFYIYNLNSLPAIVVAFMSFFAVYNQKPMYNKFINKIANTTFGVYVIHMMPAFRYSMWRRIIDINKRGSVYHFLWSIMYVILLFVICSALDYIRGVIFQFVAKKIKISGLYDIVDKRINGEL